MIGYCGKSCDECVSAEELKCNGCKGCQTSCAAECEIADCCKSKLHETCETCSGKNMCSKLNKKRDIPDNVLKRRERKAAEVEKFKSNSAVLELAAQF